MMRLTMITLFGLSSLGLAAAQPPKDEPKTPEPPGGLMVAPFKECAKACDDCARECNACMAHCAKLAATGHPEHLTTMKTCSDCAALCNAASSILSKQGPFFDIVCLGCAQACKRCGDECEKHAAHDPVMKACAEECRRCEKACRTMLANSGFNANEKPIK